MIRAAEPDRVDAGIRNHVPDRSVEFGFGDLQGMRKMRRVRRIVRVRTPDASDIGVANAHESFQVKAGVEAAADDSNPQPIFTHSLLHSRSRLPAVIVPSCLHLCNRFHGYRSFIPLLCEEGNVMMTRHGSNVCPRYLCCRKTSRSLYGDRLARA